MTEDVQSSAGDTADRYRGVVYHEDFESGELNGWASYPPCQDTAYNPFVYPGKMRPGDTNTAFIAYEEVHWNEDQLLGGVKLLKYALDRSFRLSFRYYIKTVDTPSSLEVHLPLTTGDRLVYTLKNPPANRWFGIELGWRDFEKQNKLLATENLVSITALAVRARVAKADPHCNVYFAFDDIELQALEPAYFALDAPEAAVMSEWSERIFRRFYSAGDTLKITGKSGFAADSVDCVITSFDDRSHIILECDLEDAGDDRWSMNAIIDEALFPSGMYRGCLRAHSDGEECVETPFLFIVLDRERFRSHPRLLFGTEDMARPRERFADERFASVREAFIREAEEYRGKVPLDTVVYDFDQFPDENWIESLWRWFIDRMMNFREALFSNAVVYAMLDDEVAGEYCRGLLGALAVFPSWNHPWMIKRGLHSYFPIGEMAEAYALAYDLVYDLMGEDERSAARNAMLERYIRPTYRTFVEQNRITVNTSNWISHIMGGALMTSTACLGDVTDEIEERELVTMLTGFMLKEGTYINRVFGRDGSYGEGYRYYNFAMHSFARIIPMLKKRYNVDFSGPIRDSWRETLWAGFHDTDTLFTFGDSEGYIRGEAQAYWIGGQSGPMNNWAWLVALTGNPHLSWLYHTMKSYDTFEEVLHETDSVERAAPNSLPPVAFFRDVGTAVFKSGWSSDDFAFVFRSGPFYNHQHMDQGSFFLADRGRVFLEERYDGDHHYYDDPLYQSHSIRTISHNTLLIDHNPQSQEVGDPKGFATGLERHARFQTWMDSAPLSFVTGDLTDVYNGAAKEIRRHALYIKPRTVLLVDRVVPGERDVDVSALFHTEWKKDIGTSDRVSTFRKDGASLHVHHLAPVDIRCEVKNEPHFLCQFDRRPLIERGYLETTSRTMMTPLIMAHLMTSAEDGAEPGITSERGNGWVGAKLDVDGVTTRVCVNTAGDTIDCGSYKTDALIVASPGDGGVFVAHSGILVEDTRILMSAEAPVTAYIKREDGAVTVAYHCPGEMDVSVVSPFEPKAVTVDGVVCDDYTYNADSAIVTLTLPEGDGVLLVSK